MKSKLTTNLKLALGIAGSAAIIAALCLAQPARAGNKPAPGHSSAFGNSLAQWQDTYLRWIVGETTVAPDANGNAVVNGVVLLPLPNVPGDGTPGHLDLALNHGQGFALPLFYLLGTSYTDGTPPDPMVDAAFFSTLNLTLQIGGVTVVDGSNWMDYYSQFSFAPAIPLNFPPFDAVIWCQDVAVVHAPLPVGTHTIKVDLKSTQPLPPGFGGGFPEYHNTWTLTVLP